MNADRLSYLTSALCHQEAHDRQQEEAATKIQALGVISGQH